MNAKGKSTLEKFENFLKLKNYSENTINIYKYYISELIYRFNKPIYNSKNSRTPKP